jgi:transposase
MNTKEYNQNQAMLFPPHIRRFLPDDHPAVIINDIVDTMDLSAFYSKLSSEGNPAYHPAMMLKVLVYAYSSGIFSSRKIQRALQESVAFIYLAAWQKPDFRTISDFRKNNLGEMQTLFSQLLDYCRRIQMISLGHISIDGSRIKANAADEHTWHKEKIDRTIKQLLDKANQADSDEDSILGPGKSGDEVPAPVQKHADRIKELRRIRKELEESGRSNFNTTDPDASLMKTPHGLTTGFNAQVAVDEKNQLILAEDVTNDPADVAQLVPMIEQVMTNVGKPAILSADSGYGSGENLRFVQDKGIDGYIPDPVFQGSQRRPGAKEFFERSRFIRDEAKDCFICPTGQELFFSHIQKTKKNQHARVYKCLSYANCPLRGQCTRGSNGRIISLSPYDKELNQMRKKLDSEAGKRIYRRRQTIVEPVFATLKNAIGFNRFFLRSLQKVRGEFTLVCIAHNVRKLVSFLKQQNACTQAA